MNDKIENISKGCQICQRGKWLCIFLTYKCTAKCPFCPAPFSHDKIYSSFGSVKEDIYSYLSAIEFEGISFSGGDPFVVFDRLYEWFCYFKKHFPHYYFWVYTNGINVTEDQLKHVAGAGMDEIRFNIAATGYVSEQVLKIISIARKMFPYVSVEIPSIKQDYLLLSLALPILNQIGVDYLNLHDYILTKPEIKPQEEKIGRFILNKVIQIEYMPSSRQNTQNIAEFCDNEMFTFKINHCSLEKKEIQMLNRRLVTGQVFSDKSYDFFSKEGLLYNFFCIPENDFNEKKIEKQVPIGSVVKFARYKMNKEMVCNEYCNNKMIVADCYLPQMEYNQDKIFLKTMLIKQGEFKNFLEQTGLAHLPDEREKISAERIE